MSTIPTEHVGSIPRTEELAQTYSKFAKGEVNYDALEKAASDAAVDTIKRLEETGSQIVGDGEQGKFGGFATYCLHGAENIGPNGVVINFVDGHTRRLPVLLHGPLRYESFAYEFLVQTQKHTSLPVKQELISPSLISLIYPQKEISGYPREQFINDLLQEHRKEVNGCLEHGAHKVQIDFTEARLSLKLDPSGKLLEDMVALINKGLENLSPAERQKIGVHTCAGGDKDSTHSAEVDYKDFLPVLLQIDVGNFYISMASEKEPKKALQLIKESLRPGTRFFIGVVDPINPEIETPEQVKERILQAADYIPIENLGATDDCGFSPFADDQSTSRETAFTKIKARVDGVHLAEKELLGN